MMNAVLWCVSYPNISRHVGYHVYWCLLCIIGKGRNRDVG